MQTEKTTNGIAVPRLADAIQSATRKPPVALAPTLSHVHPATLLPVTDDIRDRSVPDYRAWFDNLVADLKQYGVKVPIIVYREGERYRVIDGETRRLAALMAGNLETVSILVYEQKPDDAALKLAQLQANAMRRDNTPLELARIYQQLMTLHQWSAAELARNIHTSAASIAKVLAISTRLCAAARALVATGRLPARSAYAISRLPDHSQQAELAQKAVDLPMAAESVEEAVDRILMGSMKKDPRKNKPVKAKLQGAALEFAADFTWDRIIDLGNRIVEAGKRGAKMPDLSPAAVLPALLKN